MIDPSVYSDGLLVPCGKCIECKIAKRKEWSVRVMHELQSWDSAIFITLTYADKELLCDKEDIPFYVKCNIEKGDYPSLVKNHLQDFFKRLRKQLDVQKRKIKYYACGEYGDKSGRPHYHAIIFGMSLSEEDKILIMEAWKFCDWSVEEIRKNSFGMAEPDSIRYVAQYIDKKYDGEKANEIYGTRMVPFQICSNGLGLSYVSSHAVQLINNGYITVNGVKMALPRYYLDKLGMKITDMEYDSDKDISEILIGNRISDDDAYRELTKGEYAVLDLSKKASKAQRKMNSEAKVNLRKRKI